MVDERKELKKTPVASVLCRHAQHHHPAFCPNDALVCSVQFSHHTVIFIVCNFHGMDFLTEAYSVLCEEVTKTLFFYRLLKKWLQIIRMCSTHLAGRIA